MATLNLGRIKPVFRGAYAGGTAYVIDDIVTSGNETFICIQASTGNATSNASYWTKLAAKGTDGTDIGTTLTTQGDLLYRDGSGLQRLAKGTAAQQLAMNAGATAPEWINASSDYVKLGTATLSGTASTISLDGLFDDTTYTSYELHWKVGMTTSGGTNYLNLRFNESGSAYDGTQYSYGFMHHGNNNTGGFHDARANWGNASWGKQDSMELSNTWNESDIRANNLWNRGKLTVWEPQSTADYTQCVWTNSIGSNNSSWTAGGTGHGILHRTQAVTGITLKYRNSTNFVAGTKITMYGVK